MSYALPGSIPEPFEGGDCVRKRNKEEKAQAINELQEKLKTAKACIVTDYRGLNVARITTLRRRLTQDGVEFKVVKNTLARIALDRLGVQEAGAFFEGPSAAAFAFEDPVVAARALLDFARDNKELEIKGGLVEGRVIGAKDVRTLSELPPREILLARVIGNAAAPLTGFVSLLQAPLRNLVYVLSQVREKMEEGGLSA